MNTEEVNHRLNDLLGEVQRLLRCDAEALAAVRSELLEVAEDWPEWLADYDELPRRAQHRGDLEHAKVAVETLVHVASNEHGPLKGALVHYGSLHGLGAFQLGHQFRDLMPALSAAINQALLELGPKGGCDGQKAHSVTPKRRLAIYCLELFEYFRPGEANTTVEGEADQLLALLYEIVSGESGKSLNSVLRKELPRWRDQCKAMQEVYRKLDAGKHLTPSITDISQPQTQTLRIRPKT